MNTSVVEATVPGAADLAGLEPVEKIKRRWPMWLGGALTLLMVAGLGRELLSGGLTGLARALPSNPLFYLVFLLYYLASPTFDYVIFRRLWRIPIDGMIALHKKRIANEVLLGYSGEAYFYAWARQRTQMVAAPFGAVKDVTILSAIAGNAMTLAVVALALPFGIDLLKPAEFNTLMGSIAVIFAMSLPFLIFSKRVFSLPRGQLWWVFGIHCLRIVSSSVLIAFAWHFAMPQVSVGIWLLLSAGRLLAWRLPLVPNKELLFASFAIMIIGQGEALSELMALIAGLSLVAHIILIVGFGVHALLKRKEA
ncbi:hypothetical protein ACNFJ7_15435 [Sphingomonas sp. HT-1]|uniref:hypothetical protein n=1 Tax=unclassified Sphingomonas TaxID=196159 RepID=UPI00030F9B5B|nr:MULTISPECIES: hypothetical protein [unclassified Sphingomonas]KTF70774.1 hypothetical protein ATB93_00210 [Sphingomonas sp. WG]